MVVLTALAFVIALLCGGLIVGGRLGLGRTRYGEDKPQRFHVGDVSRLGGLAVGAGLSLAWITGALIDGRLVGLNLYLDIWYVLSWLLVLLPAVVVGQMEDVTQRLSVRYRLLATVLSGGLACFFLDAGVPRLGVDWLDAILLAWPWAGGLLALLAIAGLPHAFNIIDGYNGLAGTVALLVCLALAHVALQVGDRALAAQMMALAGATGGFLFWNYPRGLIFAGDGGSYLWGGVIALACVTLVERHPTVSPWFPALLLIYPVWETVFSIYRKSVRGGALLAEHACADVLLWPFCGDLRSGVSRHCAFQGAGLVAALSIPPYAAQFACVAGVLAFQRPSPTHRPAYAASVFTSTQFRP